jgi:integrase
MVTQEPAKPADKKTAGLNEGILAKLQPPAKGQKFVFDRQVRGLAVRMTPGGTKSFVLNYRLHGRRRRFTLGIWSDLTLEQARDDATEWRRAIRQGQDPAAQKVLDREAPTVKSLADRFLTDYSERHNRASTLRNNRQMLDGIVRPRLGKLPVKGITKADIEALHHSMRGTPYRANRILAVLSKMFSLAVEWGLREGNPVLGVAKYAEERRGKWLQSDELIRLHKALDEYPDQQSANAIRLILLTGSRKGEVLQAQWDEFDLEGRGKWRKPSHHTKQQKVSHVPLSKEALRVLREMKRTGDFLFPSPRVPGKPLENLRRAWADVCKAAKLQHVRIHDLRHTYASHLVSRGTPLATVGRLLGHTQAQTTERYAHLADDVLRAATNRAGAALRGKRGK